MAQSDQASAEQDGSTDGQGHGGERHSAHGSQKLLALMVGSIGVVYGDIGTSPLYAFKASIHHVATDGSAATRGEVMGVISLIFWALMIVVTLKYVVFVLSMDNKGEGGTLSLMALAQKALGKRTPWLFLIGVFGAALFYGDAIITPAISVLSAVEGMKEIAILKPYLQVVDPATGEVLKTATGAPVQSPIVLGIAIGILVGLFLIQSRGTGRLGRYFGPITIVWFLMMGGLGLWHLLTDDWTILYALWPSYAVSFVVEHHLVSFAVLGSVRIWAISGASRSAMRGRCWYCRV
jgi:KUP system potassium uptake protein